MKRNELFKSLMNVQSQVTSLMNVVLQEADGAKPGIIDQGKNVLTFMVDSTEKATGVNIRGLIGVGQNVKTWFDADNKLRREAIDKGVKEIEDNAKFNKETLIKIENLTAKMRFQAYDEDVRSACKYIGVALLGVACILGYLMFPGMKQNIIDAFNSGSPKLEKFGNILKGVAKASLVLLLLIVGVVLCYHGFKGVDTTNPYINSVLKLAASIRVHLDNMVESLKGKVGELKDKTGDGISPTPAWQW